MKKTLNYIANRLNLTLDDSLVDENSKINYLVTNQMLVIDFLSIICKYTNHLYTIDNTTLKVVDKLKAFDNPTLTREFDEYVIIKDSFEIEDKDIIKSFRAKYIGFKPNGLELEKEIKELAVKTSLYPAGSVQDVEVFDYVEAGIRYELNKLKKLYDNYETVSFKVLLKEPVGLFEKIIFNAGEFKGEMLVLNRSIDYESGTQTLKGLASVDNL